MFLDVLFLNDPLNAVPIGSGAFLHVTFLNDKTNDVAPNTRFTLISRWTGQRFASANLAPL